jgi:error-prone DNA polymerase
MTAYAELAVTTNFSFLRGASHAQELVERAKELGLAGLGIADVNSVAGVVRAHDAAKEHGVKLAVGARLVFADGTPDILAYPRDRAAWGRLTRLLTTGKRRSEKGQCTLYFDDLLDHVAGQSLIVMEGRTCLTTSPAPPSPPPLAGEGERRRSISPLLARLREAAPRSVWLAASMRYRGDDARRLARRAALAAETRLPLIAVGDVLYHVPERRPLQDVMTCVRTHVTLATAGRRLEANAERHLKSAEEMARLFRAAPEAVEETLRLLERCRFSLDELSHDYPDETREGYATAQEALAAFAADGARKRYPDGVPAAVRHALDHELTLIGELDYARYFLTVHDIVRYARSQNILCQGRGSAANSVVCYCLEITEVDPQKNKLLFERFVSAERREPPDIDVDFEHERREEVIQYIYRRYGRERAGLAATVICYRARSAIREVGKAFGLSDDTVGALAGTLWGWSVESVSDKHARRVGYDPRDPTLARVLALARELIGFPRHLSQHVGGFVVTRSRLDEVVPIENAAMEDRTVIEWDKDDLDTLRLLKVDVLALGMLTCLHRGLELMEKHYGAAVRLPASSCPRSSRASASFSPPTREGVDGRDKPGHDESRLPPLTLTHIFAQERDDDPVYRMLSRADSVGVFQVESRAQMSMLPRLKPRTLFDLVVEVAIVRPGPIQGDMVHPYLRRRQGLETPEYPAPLHGDKDELRDVLGETLGVPLFQEQAMRIAIVAAGFTPAQADKLRRAMATFRHVGTISYFRDKLIEGMAARGYPRDFAERCFRQIEGFGEYGFPQSHAASFALLVYASAWIKCRYPDVFAAALINSQPMGFYAPAQIVRDAKEHGVEVREVDVNHSDWDATLEPSSAIPGPSHQRDYARLRRAMARSPESIRRSAGAMDSGLAGLQPAPRNDGGEAERPRLHPRHADMANDIRATHAVRLGFRQIKGFAEADARAIEKARGAGFDSIRDLWLRTALTPAALERIALADAFRSLGLDRRQALWAVRALRRAGDKDDLPLFARVATPALEPDVALPPMRLGEHTVEDYRWLHLSLKAHPVSLLRAELDRRGVVASERLVSLPTGRRVTVAGLVLVRQRPGSANGVIFMTLEDEAAIANTIVWPQVFEQYRPIVLGARLVAVTGKLQNEQGVIHVVAERLEDLTPLLRRLADDGGDVDALVRCDEVKRPIPEWRLPPRSVQALQALFVDEPQPAGTHVEAADVGAVMPKGRNFH